MKKGHLQYRLFEKFYKKAGKNMCLDFKEYVSKNSSLLDIGCGSGLLAREIEDMFSAKVEGIDIIDNRVVDIFFQKYNGDDLKIYKDNQFDTVLISYVLHHTQNPENILKEAKRVAKKYIIIYEDMDEGGISEVYCKIHGYSFSKFFQNNDIKGNFNSEKGWKEVFEKLDLKVLEEKDKNYFLNPVKRKMFILGV